MSDNPGKAAWIAAVVKNSLLLLLAWLCAGSFLVFLASSLWKAHTVKGPLMEADVLMAQNNPGKLVEFLDATSRWEPLFPALKVRRDCTRVRAMVRRGDVQDAIRQADAMLHASFRQPSLIEQLIILCKPNPEPEENVSAFEWRVRQVERLFTRMFNATFSKQNMHAGFSNLSAYRYAVDELKAARNIEVLATVSQTLIAHSPNSALAKHIDEFIKQMEFQPPTRNITATFGWALIKQDQARCYDMQGKFKKNIDLGSLFEVLDIKKTKSGDVAVGSLHTRDGIDRDLLIPVADLDLRRGLLTEIAPGVRDLFMRRALAIKAMENAKRRTEESTSAQNPHAQEFQKVYAEYKAFRDQVDDLTSKFNAADGPERSKYADALRQMKPRDIELGRRFETVRRDYNAWKQKNPPTASADLQSSKAQLEQIESQLRSLNQL